MNKGSLATLVRAINPFSKKSAGAINLRTPGFWNSFFGYNNFSGKSVTIDSALQLSTAMACVRLISQTLSTLPMTVYRQEGDTALPAKDSQIYFLLKRKPNADMTASVFWQTFIASLLLWGNAYVEKRMSGRVLTSLEFLRPENVSHSFLLDGTREWRYVDPYTHVTRIIPAELMWHTPAFTITGLEGVSPVYMGANIFGGAIAADEASANTFKNGMKSPGLVMMDAQLSPEQRDIIGGYVKKAADNGSYLILPKGTGFQQLNMNPQDAELLSTRQFNVEEICRWYGVDPSLVGHGGKDSNWGTGLQEKRDWLVTLLLRPLAKRIEDSIWDNLLTPVEKQGMYAEFGLEGLLRGDTAARSAFYMSMTANGIMTRDECRRLENLPLMGGNAGVLTVQLNMSPLDKLGEQPAAATTQNALKRWLGFDEKKGTE